MIAKHQQIASVRKYAEGNPAEKANFCMPEWSLLRAHWVINELGQLRNLNVDKLIQVDDQYLVQPEMTAVDLGHEDQKLIGIQWQNFRA